MVETLRLEKISKSFGDLQILLNVDLTLQAGESVAILGPSGAGKSTLLHIAGLMERPSAGVVFVNEKDSAKMNDNARARERLNTIGFLFQFHHLLPDFNVLENVLIPARLAGDNLEASEKEANSLLRRLGLQDRLTHKPHQLSGGEQQRAALARALIRHPKLLLCDEPTGNLDQHTAKVVTDLIFSEVNREGVTTILVTHNEDLATQAQRSYRLFDGKFIEVSKGSVNVGK